MAVRVRINNVRRMFDDLEQLPGKVMGKAEKVMKEKTPKRSGNARRNTRKVGDTKLRAGYGYAKKLNSGWSSQAPDGFTDPTIEYIKDQIKDELGRIG